MSDRKLFLKDTMSKTRLIQRLDQPRNQASIFAFGGGLVNGGLSAEAMQILSGILSFDYMGSAEFEWGAVPAALQFIAEQASKRKVVSGEVQGIFYICPTSYEAGVRDTILNLILDERSFHLQESCGLGDILNPEASYRRQTSGWLELNNGFMFFLDEEMFKKTKQLFGIKDPSANPVSFDEKIVEFIRRLLKSLGLIS